MPGHDIGVMLHDRKHDLVAGFDALAAERIGDEIDGFGGIAGEDDLLFARGVEEGGNLFARILVGLGRLVGEKMQPAMHVGVLRGVSRFEPVEHDTRLLRRGRVVEVDKRLAIDLHRQDRKIRPDAVHVISTAARCLVHFLSSSGVILRGSLRSHLRMTQQVRFFWPNGARQARRQRSRSAPRAGRHVRCFRWPR